MIQVTAKLEAEGRQDVIGSMDMVNNPSFLQNSTCTLPRSTLCNENLCV